MTEPPPWWPCRICGANVGRDRVVCPPSTGRCRPRVLRLAATDEAPQ